MILYIDLRNGCDLEAAAEAYFESGGVGRRWESLPKYDALRDEYLRRLELAFTAGRQPDGSLDLEAASEAYFDGAGYAWSWDDSSEAARNVYRVRVGLALAAGAAHRKRNSDTADGYARGVQQELLSGSPDGFGHIVKALAAINQRIRVAAYNHYLAIHVDLRDLLAIRSALNVVSRLGPPRPTDEDDESDGRSVIARSLEDIADRTADISERMTLLHAAQFLERDNRTLVN